MLYSFISKLYIDIIVWLSLASSICVLFISLMQSLNDSQFLKSTHFIYCFYYYIWSWSSICCDSFSRYACIAIVTKAWIYYCSLKCDLIIRVISFTCIIIYYNPVFFVLILNDWLILLFSKLLFFDALCYSLALFLYQSRLINNLLSLFCWHASLF